MVITFTDVMRWFTGGDRKEQPFFKTEREAYDFCRQVYKKTNGATDELRRAYDFYLKNYNDDGCGPFGRFESPSDQALRK